MTGWILYLITAIGKVFIASAVVFITSKLLASWARRLTRRTTSDLDDRLAQSILKTAAPIGYLLALWWGWNSFVGDSDLVAIESMVTRIAEATILLLITILLVRMVNRIAILVLDKSLRRAGKQEQLAVLHSFEPMIRTVVFILGILVFLQTQGVQMGVIYASLAGAGIGVGLALKGPISNFLNYLTILLDEPFKIGHFIRFAGMLGTVESVGMRSTHVRSLSGELIVISNEELLSNIIQNYGDLPKRRIATTIGVEYKTPLKTIKQIPELVAAVIRRNRPAEFDRCHFTRFADSSLEFEFVYFVPDADIVLYLDLQQDINHGLMEEFQDKNISFAYPSQTLYLESALGEAKSKLEVAVN
ncbi:mechanosensitive ion channel family protein [Synechococcus sp. CS-602]|uniref:mechanosensitive ion channel family protein n=1 Tax=Synechococcaceae TaxID=1890426 RepID=UPI0008FF5220|nr:MULTISPECIES: mechanosensitive ion channel family protein [Synechococcaceae]MCT4363747.1 mechanosensitive ion channel family protein [Candidatus Regnicoccus frigidus MAG-AL1]APD47945.1 small-conductance mechanosensitive channel [Synechococcus sp. SynAce01]MCT0200982.1 mechanosensitive ion channel family protein [Synechococcus sp. CS-603]MCT0204924.1 mechanosensitive ion channel family protein [Synechococcus sp. CS-602]MCT0244752.1 mechanosensitive ion channel family protein [Synechococcus s